MTEQRDGPVGASIRTTDPDPGTPWRFWSHSGLRETGRIARTSPLGRDPCAGGSARRTLDRKCAYRNKPATASTGQTSAIPMVPQAAMESPYHRCRILRTRQPVDSRGRSRPSWLLSFASQLFLDLGGLTRKFSQIIQLGPTYPASAFYLDACDQRAMRLKNAFDPDTR